ncbi:MAG: radical SAM-associated putative lipoprotein [Bacteroidales bacterium]|nr:radical SAM-associated putative lipoprotein [Bacteroidales bacterium]
MKKLLNFILAILGFAGCNVLGGGEEYGTPYASFKVKGVVTDGKNPIENVKVKLIEMYHENEYDRAEPDITDSQGRFEIKSGSEIFDTLRLKIVASDLNNNYQNDTANVEFYWKELSGKKKDEKWYSGSAERTVNFTLKEKNDK